LNQRSPANNTHIIFKIPANSLPHNTNISSQNSTKPPPHMKHTSSSQFHQQSPTYHTHTHTSSLQFHKHSPTNFKYIIFAIQLTLPHILHTHFLQNSTNSPPQITHTYFSQFHQIYPHITHKNPLHI